MPKREGRGPAINLSEEEWAEIHRISGEIMEAVMAGSIAHESGQHSIRRHIEIVLARNVTAAQRTYEAALAAEETHTWEFGQHHISECRVEWCGRYRGQRRQTEFGPTDESPGYRKDQSLEDFSRYGCLEEPPPAPAGPAAYCARCARSGVGACDDFPYCPGGGKSREPQ